VTHADTLACWAVTTPGLESLVVAGLAELGLAPAEQEPGGVGFAAEAATLADALLRLDTVHRITVRLATFRATSFRELERHAAQVPWPRIVPPGGGVHFRVTSRKSRLYHQDAIAERLERAVLGERPGVVAVRAASEAEAMESDVARVPDVQRLVVRVFRDVFTISADAAGALLNRRGWRQEVAKAPLRETLAATLIRSSGWLDAVDRGEPVALVDPFCGSGTIPVEAARMACRIAPGRDRRFAAEGWPIMPEEIFTAARARARARERGMPGLVLQGFDRDAGAIAAATGNAERAGVASDVAFVRATISQLSIDSGRGWIVTNPPYGARIGERTALRDLYAAFGKVLRERRPNWELAMFSADRMLEQQLGVPLQELLRTTNGGIPVRVVRRKR
jgi:putative N6-adenine-specific DNA methylase